MLTTHFTWRKLKTIYRHPGLRLNKCSCYPNTKTALNTSMHQEAPEERWMGNLFPHALLNQLFKKEHESLPCPASPYSLYYCICTFEQLIKGFCSLLRTLPHPSAAY